MKPDSWRVVYTKPRQEFRAKEQLMLQGFEVFLPTFGRERRRAKAKTITVLAEPLFPRYFFIRAADPQLQGRTNWAAVRSTRGVSSLLRFGAASEPVSVGNELIEYLIAAQLSDPPKQALYEAGDSVTIASGPLVSMGGLFQGLRSLPDGQMRALVLIEFLGKSQSLAFPLDALS